MSDNPNTDERLKAIAEKLGFNLDELLFEFANPSFSVEFIPWDELMQIEINMDEEDER